MDIASKVMNLQEAAKWRENLRASGRKLVGTNGVFDLLHRGHAEYLNQARQAGDALLVAVNSDASVKQLKDRQAVVSEDDRAFLLASLQCVDAVVVFDNVRATEVWKAVCPDIYVKGGDYTEETLIARNTRCRQSSNNRIHQVRRWSFHDVHHSQGSRRKR